MAAQKYPPDLLEELNLHHAPGPCCGMKHKGGFARCGCGATHCEKGTAPRLCVYEALRQAYEVLNQLNNQVDLFELVAKVPIRNVTWDNGELVMSCPCCDARGETLRVVNNELGGQFFKCFACGSSGGVVEWMWLTIADRSTRNAWKEAKHGTPNG